MFLLLIRTRDPNLVLPAAGTGEVKPGEATDVTAAGVGAKVRFSGHDVDKDLDITVHELADGAARVAEAETGGTVLASPVSVKGTASLLTPSRRTMKAPPWTASTGT